MNKESILQVLTSILETKVSNKESLHQLLVYVRECDPDQFISIYEKHDKSPLSSFDLLGIRKWIQENYETGRSVLSSTAMTHIMQPKSANYFTGIIVGFCAMWFLEAYHNHPEFNEFMKILVECIPNLKELIQDAMASVPIPREDLLKKNKS